MSTQFPVHPDDIKQLLYIRRYLIGYRITNGWTQHELSQMISKTNGMVYDLEANRSWQWRLSRLQAWPVPFGLRLDATLRFPSIEDDDDPFSLTINYHASGGRDLESVIFMHEEVQTLWELSRRPGASHMWLRSYLLSALSVARRELGVSTDEMAGRLGITRKAVSNWENSGNEMMLPKVLLYARNLGGFIELGLSDNV